MMNVKKLENRIKILGAKIVDEQQKFSDAEKMFKTKIEKAKSEPKDEMARQIEARKKAEKALAVAEKQPDILKAEITGLKKEVRELTLKYEEVSKKAESKKNEAIEKVQAETHGRVELLKAGLIKVRAEYKDFRKDATDVIETMKVMLDNLRSEIQKIQKGEKKK